VCLLLPASKLRYPFAGQNRQDTKMTLLDDVKINNAVHECLDRCYETDDSLPVIAAFLDELKKIGDWREAEIHEVELAVHKLLQQVSTGGSDRSSAAETDSEVTKLDC
jgi:hypothetical protein